MIPWPIMLAFWFIELAVTPLWLLVILLGVFIQWLQRQLQWGKVT